MVCWEFTLLGPTLSEGLAPHRLKDTGELSIKEVIGIILSIEETAEASVYTITQ